VTAPRVDDSQAPALAVHVEVPERGQRWDLDVPVGTVLALVGPNGAGKSSVLRCVTGQLRPAAGTVAIDGAVMSGLGRYVPVHRRQVAILEQRPLLLPHLDVLENVAFGLRARGVRRGPARARAAERLAAVGCADLAGRRAWQLSGGQAQRVALARALATDPRLLLLDEPMAALDVSVAPAMRLLLRDILRDQAHDEPRRTAVLVTHDVLDALALADRIALVEDGRVAAQGSVEEMLARPTTPFLAELVGVNLLAGTACGPDTLALPTATGQEAALLTGVAGGRDRPLRPGRHALATFPPDAVSVHLGDPGGSPRNHLRALVASVEPRGALVRVTARLADGEGVPPGDEATVAADLTAAAAVELGLRPGLDVRLVVKATQVTLYER
jgi:molybdate transport system ATP-binding protein